MTDSDRQGVIRRTDGSERAMPGRGMAAIGAVVLAVGGLKVVLDDGGAGWVLTALLGIALLVSGLVVSSLRR